MSLCTFVASITLTAAGIANAQDASALPRGFLVERARLGFDRYMLKECEGARLARIQQSVFPDNWNHLRERFADTAADKIQGKISRDEAQRRYAEMIRSSFAEIETEILNHPEVLGHAPRQRLVAWEAAFGQHLGRYLTANPNSCSVAEAMRMPVSPNEMIEKLDLLAAFWSAYGEGKAAPVNRQFETVPEGDVVALDHALAATGARDVDRSAIIAGDKLADVGKLSCGSRLALSKALLAMEGPVEERLLAHTISRKADQ